jgi:hypothetical protein
MIHGSVEKAMDRGEIAFTPVGDVQDGGIPDFKLVIIDPSILERKTALPWKAR